MCCNVLYVLSSSNTELSRTLKIALIRIQSSGSSPDRLRLNKRLGKESTSLICLMKLCIRLCFFVKLQKLASLFLSIRKQAFDAFNCKIG